MPVAWHPNKWWNFCISEDEKKKYIKFLLRSCKSVWIVYSVGVLKHFIKECIGSIQLRGWGGGRGRGGGYQDIFEY